MKISVFIPTYCRTQDLHHCLEALKKQHRLPDEVVLTVRDTDHETHKFLANYDINPLSLVISGVTQPGLIDTHQYGYQAASGDIVAITGDNAAPRSDWLAKIEEHYLANPTVGGRDRDLRYDNSHTAQTCVCYF